MALKAISSWSTGFHTHTRVPYVQAKEGAQPPPAEMRLKTELLKVNHFSEIVERVASLRVLVFIL